MPAGYGLQTSRPSFVRGQSLLQDTGRALNQGLGSYQTVAGMMLSNREQDLQEKQYANRLAAQQDQDIADAQREQRVQENIFGALGGGQQQFQPQAPALDVQQALGGSFEQAPIVGDIVQGVLGQLGQQQNIQALKEQSDARREKQRQQMSQLIVDDPNAAKMVMSQIGVESPAQVQEAYNFARSVKDLPYDQQTQAIQQRAEQVYNRGGDPKDTMELLQMSEEQRGSVLDAVEIAAGSTLKPTSDIQNFEYGEGLKERFGEDSNQYQTWLQQKKIKSGDEIAVNIEAKRLNNALKSMQVDEIDEKIFQKQELNLRKADNEVVTSDEMIDLTDAVLNHEGLDRAIGSNSWTPTMPAGKAADFMAMKDELTNKAGFQNLITMKNLGATFGALSESELKGLQQSAVNLEKSQSPSQFKANLNRFKAKLNVSRAKQQAYLDKLKKRYPKRDAAVEQEQDNNVVDWSSM